MISTIAICALLSAAFYYLGSRAVITSWLWSRYPPRLAKFMDCAACSGFWYGVLTYDVMIATRYIEGSFLASLGTGLCTLVTTPILGGLMQWGFDTLGSVVPDDNG